MPFDTEEKFIRAPAIRQRYDISDATLFRWVRSGKFPAPEFINDQRVWRQSVLEAAEAKLISDTSETHSGRLSAA